MQHHQALPTKRTLRAVRLGTKASSSGQSHPLRPSHVWSTRKSCRWRIESAIWLCSISR